MATITHSFTTVVNEDMPSGYVGDAWTDPTGASPYVTLTGGHIPAFRSKRLVFSGPTGGSLPAGTTPTGIKISTNLVDLLFGGLIPALVSLRNGAAAYGAEKTSSVIDSIPQNYDFGDASDAWGGTLSTSLADNLAVVLRVQDIFFNEQGTTIAQDTLQAIVTYTPLVTAVYAPRNRGWPRFTPSSSPRNRG